MTAILFVVSELALFAAQRENPERQNRQDIGKVPSRKGGIYRERSRQGQQAVIVGAQGFPSNLGGLRL